MGNDFEKSRIRIGIMGAGIAGCCLAIGLLKNPLLDVQLYEAHSDVRVRGLGLALHGNAIRAMDLISPEIKKVYFEKSHYMANEEDIEMATQFIIASGQHAGTVAAELGKAKGRRTVHRAHFIQGLLECAIPSDRVHFGKRAIIISEDSMTREIAVSFDDETQQTFDVLIGAEGVYSPTRKFILGPNHPTTNPVNHDGWRQFYLGVPMEKAKKTLPKESIERVRCYCTPLGFINGIPVDFGQTYSIGCYQRDSKCPEKSLPFKADLWKGFLPEVDALVSLLEQNAREDWVLQDHDHAPTYYRGQVAMVGDAAHATLPHAGNGAAQAIEDCAILTGILSQLASHHEIESALKAFDEIRRPRSQRVIDITRNFGKLYSQETEDINLDLMKAELREGGMFTNNVDMTAQLQSAIEAFEQHRKR